MRATFDATASVVWLDFDTRPTNRAAMGDGVQGPCSAVFDDVTVARMQGTSDLEPICLWFNATRVRAQLGRLTQLMPLDLVTVRSGAIHPATMNGVVQSGCIGPGGEYVCAEGSVAVAPPDTPQIPTAVLSAPAELSACDDLLVSGLPSSGGGIFPLTYTWSVVSTGGIELSAEQLASIGALLEGNDEVTIPATLIPMGSVLDFSLTVRSRIGTVSPIASASVSKPGGIMLTTTFEGGATERTTLRPERTSITGQIAMPQLGCLSDQTIEAGSVVFSWSIRRAASVQESQLETSSDAEGLVILSNSLTAQLGRRLIVREDTLSPGASYAVTLHATPTDTASGIAGSHGTFMLHVGSSPLVVMVAGGSSSRTQGAALPLVLDASSASHDPDAPTAPLDSFAWTCTQSTYSASTGYSCRTAAGTADLSLTHGQAATGVLAFAAGELRPLVSYVFTVVGSKGTRTNSFSMSIEVLAGSPPTVGIQSISAGLVATDGSLKVNPDVRLSLGSHSATPSCSSLAPSVMASSASCVGSFSWVVQSGLLSLSDPLIRTSQVNSPFLVIAANALIGGQQYTLQLSVLDVTGGATGSAQLVVIANMPPTGGSGLVTPAEGIQFNTTFRLDQEGWFDEDLPLAYSYDFTLGSEAPLDCRREAAGWEPLVGDLAQARFFSATWPAGSIIIRAVAQDSLGARACTALSIVVVPPTALASGDAAAASNFVSDQLASLTEEMAQGQGGGVQAVAVLAGLLYSSSNVSSSVASTCANDETEEVQSSCVAVPLTREERELLQQQQALTAQMLTVLSDAPPAEASTADKLIHASALESVVNSPSGLTESSRDAAMDALSGLASSLRPDDNGGGVTQAIVGALDFVIDARDSSTDGNASAARRLSSSWALQSWWRVMGAEVKDLVWREELEEAELVDEGAFRTEDERGGRLLSEASSGDAISPSAASSVPEAINVVRTIAAVQYEAMVVGEAPLGDVGRTFTYGVQRGFAGSAMVLTPELIAPSGFIFPDEVTQGMDDAMVLTTDFAVLPFSPPPKTPGKPKNGQASSAVGVALRAGSVYLPAFALSEGESTHVKLKRQQSSWLFSCLDDSDCAGVVNMDPPVDGQCVDGRCRCPMPWAGQRCDRLLECWWRTSSWHGPNHTAGCQLNISASDSTHLVCTCPVGGTFDTLVVSRPQFDLVRRSWFPFNTIDFPRDFKYLSSEYLERGWIAGTVLAVVTGAYLVSLLVAFAFGNESEVRKNARYYDFWREQRKNRIARVQTLKRRLTIAEWLALTVEQLKNQHKVFRIFTMKYDATLQDASAAPTPQQKISVLYTIITIKLMVAAALFDPVAAQTYTKKSETEQYLTILLNGQIVALVVMPANVIMDRLFNMQQRVVNRHASHGISTEVAMIARQGFLSIMNSVQIRRAIFDWMWAVQLIKVDSAKARLVEHRSSRRLVMADDADAKKSSKEMDRALTKSKLIERVSDGDFPYQRVAVERAGVTKAADAFVAKISPHVVEAPAGAQVTYIAGGDARQLPTLCRREIIVAQINIARISRGMIARKALQNAKEDAEAARKLQRLVRRRQARQLWAVKTHDQAATTLQQAWLNKVARTGIGAPAPELSHTQETSPLKMSSTKSYLQRQVTTNVRSLLRHGSKPLQVALNPLRRSRTRRVAPEEAASTTTSMTMTTTTTTTTAAATTADATTKTCPAGADSRMSLQRSSSLRRSSTRRSSTNMTPQRRLTLSRNRTQKMSAIDQAALLDLNDGEGSSRPTLVAVKTDEIDRSSFAYLRSTYVVLDAWRRAIQQMDETGELTAEGGQAADPWLGTQPAEQPLTVQKAGGWIPYHRRLRKLSLTRWYFQMCESPIFWKYTPWVFVIFVNGLANFFCLLYCCKYFAFNEVIMMAWLYQFLAALTLGLLVIHTLIVIAKNNMAWSRKIMKTKRYQILEKFFITPLLPLWRALCIKFCGEDILEM